MLKAPQVSEYLRAKEVVQGEDLRKVTEDWMRSQREQEELVASSDPHGLLYRGIYGVQDSKCFGIMGRFAKVNTSPHQKRNWNHADWRGTREGIDIYLERNPWSQDTRANHRKVLNMFFEWAVDTDRISVHPVKKSKTIALRHGTPKILTLEEAERFLRLGEKDDPGLVYAMILGLFAGIRGQEVCRMR